MTGRTGYMAAALAALTATAALPAMAHPGPTVRAQDPASVAAGLKAANLPATIGTDKSGDPMITSAYEGTTFQLFFYNCTNNRECATIQFHSGYHLSKQVSVERLNEWNRNKRFGRAFLDAENDPILEMDVDLDDGGLSEALFIDNLEFWESILPEFEEFIGYRKPTATGSSNNN